ncbi:gamma carbonic anhydrase family protein [Rhodococcus sp. UNC23MFCrub1.1]|uniref:gamma carbonic anhydrase family protein n=1 Tax=Rhodococcus sp. UNC23MFCrub1.1 TaxID=1449068 RepID=UPI0006897366|nr:gamma carbonic anhydrase family protein [Rhodococcus sp. UNC23MFCrub1.1]
MSSSELTFASLWALDAGVPNVDARAWISPTSTLIGRVTVGPEAGIWYGAVLRAEFEDIQIGEGSNIQDGVVAHVDVGFALTVGRNVSVGHNAVLHGCTVEDGVLIGMNAVVMNGAVIGEGSLIAAGALVLEGSVIPSHSLVAGVPAKVRRTLTADEMKHNQINAENYRNLIEQHRRAIPCAATDA